MEPPSPELLSRTAATLAAASCVGLALENRISTSAWVRRGVAALLALAGIAVYFQLFTIPAPQFFHRWEMFHYVLGSKYADELGYERLYECVALADAESGHRDEVEARTIRDLHDDESISAARVLAEPERCLRHFSPARWASFRTDVAIFRRIVGDRQVWADMQ